MSRRLPVLSPTAWFTIERLTQQFLWLILFTILAPILGPRPYGVFAIVMAFIGLCEIILQEGGTEALLTVDHLDADHIGTANVCNMIVGVTAAILIFILAPLISKLFDNPDIKLLLWSLIPLPIFSALMATPIALLRHSLRFRPLAIRSITGLTIGGIIGVILALVGAGVWALAMQVLAQRFFELVILVLSSPSSLKFRWSHAHFREMAHVARNIYFSRGMSLASGQIPRMIIGYILGPLQLGLFTLATRILDIVTQIAIQPRAVIGRIELRQFTASTTGFENTFKAMVQEMAMLSFPLIIGAAMLTPDLFSVWLDHRWNDAVLPTQLSLLSGIPTIFFFCSSAALLADKRSGSEAWINFLQSLTLSATVLATAPFGLVAACTGLLIRPAALLPVPLFYLNSFCKLSLRAVLGVALAPLSGSLLMAGLVYLARNFLRQTTLPEMPSLFIQVGLGTGAYFMFLLVVTPRQFRGMLTRLFAI